MEEERRLCYVGITRAKERLYLLYAFRRSYYGSSEPGDPSRFLADIPRNLQASVSRPQSMRRMDSDERDETPRREYRREAVAAISSELEFHAGDKVEHSLFGRGTVVSSRISGTDEEVQVAFDDIGVKRLIARYAGLKKI